MREGDDGGWVTGYESKDMEEETMIMVACMTMRLSTRRIAVLVR